MGCAVNVFVRYWAFICLVEKLRACAVCHLEIFISFELKQKQHKPFKHPARSPKLVARSHLIQDYNFILYSSLPANRNAPDPYS
jgi:hypothetical protein